MNMERVKAQRLKHIRIGNVKLAHLSSLILARRI